MVMIFWKPVSAEDGDLYSNGEYNTTTFGVITQTDRVLNYTMGAVLTACFILSTFLNPLILRYHISSKRSNATAFLFKSLAVTDFLTNLACPVVYAWFMFRTAYMSGSLFIIESVRAFACTMGCSSQCATTLLAITRFIKVIFPFSRIERRCVVCYYLLYSADMFINNTPTLLIKYILDFTTHRELYFTLCRICIWLNALHCSIGIVFSSGTVIYLYFTSRTTANSYNSKLATNNSRLATNNKQASLTILLMNIPYVIGVCFLAVVYLAPVDLSIHDIIFGIVPMMTSALNPLIITWRNKDVREFVKCAVVNHRGSDLVVNVPMFG